MDLIREENEKLPINERVVVKSNKIIEARYHLGLNEQRIIALLTLAIKPYSTEFETYRLNVKEFARIFEIAYTGDLIDRLREALESLKIKKFTPYEDDLKRKFGKKSWSIAGWIADAEYREGEATIDIVFNEKLKPYYLQIQEDFTQFPSLEQAIRKFKCAYTYRLHELLKAFAFKAKRDGTYERVFEYEELREKLGIRPDQYLKISHFKDRVIDPAIKELNKYTEVIVKKIKYESLGGRSTSHVHFFCYKSEQLSLPLGKQSDGIISVEKEKEEVFDIMIELGVTKVTARRLCNNYNIDIIKRNIDFAIKEKERGKIKTSFQGFLVKAISEDYGSTVFIAEEIKNKEKEKLAEEKEKEKNTIAKKKEENSNKLRELKESALATFDALDSKIKDELRNKFPSVLLDNVTATKAFAKSKKKERDPIVSTAFISFLGKENIIPHSIVDEMEKLIYE